MRRLNRLFIVIPLLLGTLLLASCATGTKEAFEIPDPQNLRIFHGTNGAAISWDSVLDEAGRADIVLVGERHGHPVGLSTAAALWEGLAAQYTSSALSMEFFARDQQVALDDYLAGVTDEEQFRKAARRSEGNYPQGHQRMIETAKEMGRPVIAANPPRRYLRFAGREGYDKLGGLTPGQQRLYKVPESIEMSGRYWDDFVDVMLPMLGTHGTDAPVAGEDDDGGDDKNRDRDDTPDNDVDDEDDTGAGSEEGDRPKMTQEERKAIAKSFRGQSMWDSTMTDSLLNAISAGYRPVVLIVGQFHVNYGGGIVARLRQEQPGLRLWTISVVDEWSDELREEDQGKADCIVYIGPDPDDD